MRIISDFRLFEKPPKPSAALLRWIAWRWLVLGLLVASFVALVAAMNFLGGEPIHYTNEGRNLTEEEVWELVRFFLSIGGVFLILGLLGISLIPKD
ncbi:hypothetical protein [Aurantiacibacter rhizosphaerae]|uniref:Uncharacterized protein n=1 Tax=Aurantiacibacter rhizosphaerae TaxID=2691582 RepID=A0A844XDJ7_9SPHN|nr:hypothetical protein [Aurantiacibacter rhizosphaerae]MWV28076.1 hypothetical protein [Aurantiacibacter rhizosphaerae]